MVSNLMAKKVKKNLDFILSIDSGTQSVRSSLIDLKGHIHYIVKIPIEPYFSNQPGWAEQEPEYYWKNLCSSSKKLFKDSGVNKKQIKAVKYYSILLIL